LPPAAIPQAGPSVWQKLKMGFMMGTGVGLTIGFIFGGYSILRGGAGPRGALATLSQYMLSSAATFGFFLSIGSVIRNDSNQILIPAHLVALQMQLSPILRTRAEGAAKVRATWEAEKRRRQTTQ